MGCAASTVSADSEFINGKPTFKGDSITKGFSHGNGLLFRIVNKKSKQWAYYNDTKEYEMHIKVTFSIDCDITALGKTKLEKLDSGEFMATVVVLPLQTELFIEGHVNGFKARMDAVPLSDNSQDKDKIEETPNQETVQN
ncbi:unnamed protein product [Phytomonas sp. Hart1]|nr:unnamed protein product [Phytomonas sp. Hart1]|eukprot:CCW66386.1 unnamed protein product [Phytomonas sp. isolate Hart1]